MVTDPAKRVTDPAVITELKRQGMDRDYVEFCQDYAPRYVNGRRVKGRSPYAKFYRDLKSNKRMMVVSGLPKVDADGVKIVPQWEQVSSTPRVFQSKANIFSATVSPSGIQLSCKSDQPDDRKLNDRLSFNPRLFLDGREQPCGDAILLPTDPVNDSYAENTLEWDYGICKRRLRIIEGRIHGSWVFAENPGGEVSIEYNQSGDYRLKLGRYKINDDEEAVPREAFDSAEYPFTVSDSSTYYPDAHAESTSVDGYVAASGSEWTWAEIIAHAGVGSSDTVAKSEFMMISAWDATDKWEQVLRSIFLFDTSGLDDGATISAATFSVYGDGKDDGLSVTPDINVYSSDPASNDDLVSGDYDSLGTTAYCDTAITYAGFDTSDYNDFAFNATGLAAISKTGVTKLGLRNASFDVSGTPPTWSAGWAYSRIKGYFAEQGTGYKPKLVVTYTTGPTEKSSAESGSGSEASSPQATLSKADGGSGAELLELLAALAATAETGSGVETASKAFCSADAGSGAEALLARLLAGSESGEGAEALLARLLENDDSGSGADGYSSLVNDLITAVLSADGGAGLEALLSRALGASENGDGWERLRAKIARSAGASDMKLPTSMGQAEMPPKE